MLLQKHQNSWANDFIKIKEVIESNLQHTILAIEHIGSTSIKDLAAKAIIDIDIIYDESQSFNAIKIGLEKLGYYHNGDQGIVGREVFKRNNQKEEHLILDAIKHHLYVCQNTNIELQRHLAFRDYLRENNQAKKEYESLKYDIANKANQDNKVYAMLKETLASEFIESIIQK